MARLRSAFPSIGAVMLSGLALAQPRPPLAALPAPAAAPSAPAATPATLTAPLPPPAAASPPPQVELPPPGSLSGRLLLPSGGVPKQGAVYLEGTASAGSSSPRDKVVLSQRGGRFSPDFLVIIAGQAVAFSNDDRLTHSIFSVSSAKSFDLGHALPGEARTLTFERPGVVELFCNIHQTEQATIVVVPSAAYALLTADGSYQLSSIPAGRYRLVAYAPQGGQLVQSVEIRPRERTVVNLKFGQAGPVGAPAKPR